jgi:hypothetical protein
MDVVLTLKQIVEVVPDRLLSLTDQRAAVKPAPGKWSPKEELGHLIDSAANNHQRIVRAQLETAPRMPGYDGDAWVLLHGYQQRDWRDLVGLWAALNRQLFQAASKITDAALSRTCTIADSEPLTIRFILEDYVTHLLHHLHHIGVHVSEFGKAS